MKKDNLNHHDDLLKKLESLDLPVVETPEHQKRLRKLLMNELSTKKTSPIFDHLRGFWEMLRFNQKRILVPILIFIMLFSGGLYYLFKDEFALPPAYATTYRLTSEKISQSAPIVVNLPKGVSSAGAYENVQFTPPIKGEWEMATGNERLLFKPTERLILGSYYLAELATPAGAIRSDFQVVEDPRIVAIFPQQYSEAAETSEITIVFNRPMVPLTTLGYLERRQVPVEITPATRGRFKWISTNTLQFIPQDRLLRSSRYKVAVKSGLVSLDGLEVKGSEIEFISRKLRYISISEGALLYNQPLALYFNQPVDLEKTRKEITLTGKNANLPFLAQFGRKQVEGTNREEVDRSVILIYNQKDSFGREKLWDFYQDYHITVRKVFPAEGNIVLEEARHSVVKIVGPLESVTAESLLTQYAEPDFFDPEGKLWLSFYEDIDLTKTVITSPKIKTTGYGEKFIDDDANNISATSGEKITDKKKVFLTFNPEMLAIGEKFTLTIEKLINTGGLQINREPLNIPVSVYPAFKVRKTSPPSGATSAQLDSIVLISNTPIVPVVAEEINNHLQLNLDYQFNHWESSWRASVEQTFAGLKVNKGEFITTIHLGLMPKSAYQVELLLTDSFGQKASQKINFTTGEMPSKDLRFHHLQNPYSVTTPAKTKLNYATINMEFVNLEIYKLSASEFLKHLQTAVSFQSPVAISNYQEKITTKINLPKKYWIRNFFQIDIRDYFQEPLGHYIIVFSHPEYLSTEGNWWQSVPHQAQSAQEKTYLTITDLGVVEKRILPASAEGGISATAITPILTPEQIKDLYNLYWVNSLTTLEPVTEAVVTLYEEQAGKIIQTSTHKTDSQGLVQTPTSSQLIGVVISKGKDSTILPANTSRLNWVDRAYAYPRIYLYTDKPIYRGGQELHFKGIFLSGYDGNYQVPQNKKIKVIIYNQNSDQLYNQELTINENGTFNGSLILEKNSPPGWYYISAGDFGYDYFEVLEYVPAPFEVKVKSDQDEFVSKDTVNLEVDARYYFGVPLEGGEVTYTVSSQHYYFDRFPEEYFNFGLTPYLDNNYVYGDRFLLRGRTTLDSNGKAKISQLLDVAKLFPEEEDRSSKIIVFNLTVQNIQGQSVSAQKSFILHAGEFYLGLKSDQYFAGVNENFALKVKSVTTKGEPLAVNSVTLNLYKIDWIYSKRQGVGGGFQYQWERKKELISTNEFSTDTQGNYSQTIQFSKEGEYEAEIKALDSRNNRVATNYLLYVYGKGEVQIKPTTDTQLEIEVERKKLNVGEEGKILIKSPFARAKALISLERGRIFDYEIKEVEGNLLTHTFTVKEEHLPTLYVSVVLISAKPEVKYGLAEFQIDTSRKELILEVQTNKKEYLPGEEVKLTVLSKDYLGKPVSAEVSIAVVDKSVLALKGNPQKDPLAFFYSGFPLNVSTASNLKEVLVEVNLPKFRSKGGGASLEDDLARKERGEFKETAFWQAVLTTDSNGRAEVKFRLPDNLTTWQIETLGLTNKAWFGINYQEFISRKELMVVPLKPRFVVPGDLFRIGAQIFNQSDKVLNLTVDFASPTLLLTDTQSSQQLNIAAGKEQTLFFSVQAPQDVASRRHSFTLKAAGGGLIDEVTQTISITANHTYEVVATSNFTTSTTSREYLYLTDEVLKDQGELTINTSATLAVFLSPALKYLLAFPYGCSEQIASKLNALAIVERGLNLPNLKDKFNLEKIKYQNQEYTLEEAVTIGLTELYNQQNWDGGFAYFRGMEANFYLTLQVIEALHNLKLANYQVNQHNFNRALDFIYNKLLTDPAIYNDRDTVILSAYILSLLSDPKYEQALSGKITDYINDELYLKDKASSITLSMLSLLLSRGNYPQELKEKVNFVLDNRLRIDGRGAYLASGEYQLWQFYETPIKNTALYLKSQVVKRADNPLIDRVIRWLLHSRHKDGAWGSTNNTLAVIEALTEFLIWKKETQADFTLDTTLNENTLSSTRFTANNILEQHTKTIPLKDLRFNEVNLVTFNKTDHNQLSNTYYYDMSLKYYLPTQQIPPRDEGFSITRQFYRLDDKNNQSPLLQAKVGEVVRVRLQITVPEQRNFVMIEDFIPAGMEIVNLDLATEQKSLLLEEEYQRDEDFWRKTFDRSLHPRYRAIYHDRVFLFLDHLAPGVYEFEYFARALIRGRFSQLPAMVSEMYFPENFGRTAGRIFVID